MRGKNILMRLVITFTMIGLVFGGMMCFEGSKGFFGKITNGMKSYNTIAESELKNNQPINGKIMYIYDCIRYEYTEDDNGNQTITSYFYTVPFEENKIMLVETKANSSTEKEMDSLYKAPDYDEYAYMLDKGVEIEGLLVKNDSAVVSSFNTWKSNQENIDFFKSNYNIDISNFEPVAYTLDLTSNMAGYTTKFFIGAGLLVITIGGWIAFFIFLKGGNKKLSPANAYNQTYGQQNFGTVGLGTQPNYNVQNNNAVSSYIPQQSAAFSEQGQTQNTAVSFGQTAAPVNGTGSYIPQQSNVSNYIPNQTNSTAAQQGFTSNAGFIPNQTNSFGSTNNNFNAQPASSFGSTNNSFNAQPASSFGSTNNSFNAQPASPFGSTNNSFNAQQSNSTGRNTTQPVNVNLNNKTVIATPQQEMPQTSPYQSTTAPFAGQSIPQQNNSIRKDSNRVFISKDFISKNRNTDVNNTNGRIDITKH